MAVIFCGFAMVRMLPRHFNGTSWATPSISGVTGSTIVNVTAHKTRLFFVLINSLKFGYLPVASVAGTVATFDLASIAQKGGSLQAIGTWTRDGGDGSDDLAVFLTSEGEAIVYAGTNPGSADAWNLWVFLILVDQLAEDALKKLVLI